MILEQYQAKHHKPLKPVNCRCEKSRVPEQVSCPHCNAPHIYIYFNDGKKRTQLKCKVCKNTFQIHKPLRGKKTKYYCPYCFHALYQWKRKFMVTIFKCGNDNCPHRTNKLKALNASEKLIRKMTPTHFKVNYQYREYHFTPPQIRHSAPLEPNQTKVDLFKINYPDQVLGLILTFYISFACSARKTAMILRMVFNIKVSHQTVLNYTQAVAYYAHQFNLETKAPMSNISVADETYIKVKGLDNYVWFVIAKETLSITAYHISDNRETISAVATLNEATKNAEDDQDITFITDGWGAYTEGIQFLNSHNKHRQKDIKHIQVIGLQDADEVSAQYRPFKQIIERFNRTYKHHVKPSAGFNSFNGAMALTTLFVTYYNFLRPHMTLNYKTPIHIEQLEGIDTIQARWVKLISMMI